MEEKIIVGSRESKLAVIQSMTIVDFLKTECQELEVSLLTMKTTGDKVLDKTLDQVGGKGLFVKELDLALRKKGGSDRSQFKGYAHGDSKRSSPDRFFQT